MFGCRRGFHQGFRYSSKNSGDCPSPDTADGQGLITRVPALCSFVLIALLAGCSSDDDGDSGGGAAETAGDLVGVSDPAPDGGTPADTFTVDEALGTWVLGCQATPSTEAPYITSRLDMAPDTAQLNLSVFTDSACTNRTAETITEFSVEFFADSTTTALGEANHINLTAESITINGVTVSAGTNSVRYDIILVTNDSLYLGDLVNSGNGSSPETRPTELNQSQFFVMGDAG